MIAQNHLTLLTALLAGSSIASALPGGYGSGGHGPGGYGPSGSPPSHCNTGGLYPNIAETSHASSEAVSLFHEYFTAKSARDNAAFRATFNPTEAEYYDSTLGLAVFANRSELDETFSDAKSVNGTIPPGRSYPLRILGDTVHGAVVYFVDTPALYGAEGRALTSFDFLDGKIRRQLDNWDGRSSRLKEIFPSSPVYPYSLGLDSQGGIPEVADPLMQKTARAVQAALSAGDANAAGLLFSPDGVFEDLTLRARVDGRIDITAYLQRTLAQLPYGKGTKVTHVLGSASGGGYEWRPAGDTVRYGITALELDCSGNITRFTTVWDGSRVSRSYIQGLGQLAPTP